jgi:alpha-ketoglutarate-dependent taurine dioxygenase
MLICHHRNVFAIHCHCLASVKSLHLFLNITGVNKVQSTLVETLLRTLQRKLVTLQAIMAADLQTDCVVITTL